MEFVVPLENFSLIWRRHHSRWTAANFDLCAALMAIEQWGFFNVPHLLRHGTTVYNGHLRGPVTLTALAERLVVKLSLPACFYDLSLSRPGIEPRSPACEANALPLRHRGGCLTYKATKWDGLSDETAKTEVLYHSSVARRSLLSVWQLTAKYILRKKIEIYWYER